jgi:hypothetical protein
MPAGVLAKCRCGLLCSMEHPLPTIIMIDESTDVA